jgi:hypothetical protein
MSPSPWAALALFGAGLAALLVPPPVAFALAIAVVVATVVDMFLARRRPRVRRRVATTLARGVPAGLVVETVTNESDAAAESPGSAHRVQLRQAQPPDLTIDPATGWGPARCASRRAPAGRAPAASGRGPEVRAAAARRMHVRCRGNR